MRAEHFWDLQLVQNYVHPLATFGDVPFAERLQADAGAEIPMFRKEEITVIVTGGEAKGYWQIFGARPQAPVPVDDWR